MHASCEVCGNTYDKAFRIVSADGANHIFDSFECAIQSLAPACTHCHTRVIGHGIESEGHFFCCGHCARISGAAEARDRV